MNGSTGEFIKRSNLQIARAGRVEIALFLVFTSLPYIVLELYYPEDAAAYLFLNFGYFALAYLLFRRLMRVSGCLENGQWSGIGTFFGIGIVKGLGIGLGLIALVIPGLYLGMRWLAAYPRGMASSDGIIGSLGWSWQETASWQRPLALALVGPIVCYILLVLVFAHYEYIYYPDGEQSFAYELLSSLVSNLLIGVADVWLTLLGISSYLLVSNEGAVSREKSAEQLR